MKMGSLLATAAVIAAFSAAPAAAQQSQDCRCVDRDGNEIENCSCFRTPRFEGFGRVLTLSDSRPRLGISVDANQSARRDASGALVTEVLEDGPADDAGIRRGDVITSIDGQSLFEPLAQDLEEDFDLDESIPVQRLLAISSELEPGEEVEIAYLRDGEERTTTAEAEDLSESWGRRNFALAAPRFDAERLRGQLRALTEGVRVQRSHELEEMTERLREDAGRWEYSFGPGERGDVQIYGGAAEPLVLSRYFGAFDGLDLFELNPTLGEYFGAEEGVLVADVSEESTLGLEPGDVVLEVGERPVSTPEHLRRILRSYAPDEEISFRIMRDGAATTVSGRLDG